MLKYLKLGLDKSVGFGQLILQYIIYLVYLIATMSLSVDVFVVGSNAVAITLAHNLQKHGKLKVWMCKKLYGNYLKNVIKIVIHG